MAGRAGASAGDSARISPRAQWGLPQVEKVIPGTRSHSPNLVLERGQRQTGRPRYATLRHSPCRVHHSPPPAVGVRQEGRGLETWRDAECG